MVKKRMVRWLKIFLISVVMLILVAIISITGILLYYTKDLPDYHQLSEYHPPIMTRLYAADGTLVEEYALEKRLFVPYQVMPKQLINAFLAAEDKNFFKHGGIDMFSIIRAAGTNFINFGNEGHLVGGSTITQQVVKNFLLTNEQTLARKVKEAVLAIRITRAFSKQQILELYLNQIFLGNRSYGVAAAALNYFNKSINELSISEMAMLASLPKAPSEFNPYRNYKRAKERRDWVLGRMIDEQFITEQEYLDAAQEPIRLRSRSPEEIVQAEYFAETVRKNLLESQGDKMLYEGGLAVRTTLSPELQQYATQSLREGIIAFDHRKGWRGPLTRLSLSQNWQSQLGQDRFPKIPPNWQETIVLEVSDKGVKIGLKDGNIGFIKSENMKWALRDKSPTSLFKGGDIILAEKLVAKDKDGKTIADGAQENLYSLQQLPLVNGAIVVIDPNNGRVLALEGGFLASDSQFDRATQAKRQPGSAFKPFVYLTALEQGFTPASIIVDTPISLDQGAGLPAWQPKNYSGEFYGPTPLRQGLEYSRNAMTVQLAQMTGIDRIIETGNKFHILENASRNYSLVLGSSETTLLNLTNAYAMLVNGGKYVTPSMIERIQDRNGKTIYSRDERLCSECKILKADKNTGSFPPNITDIRDSVTDPQSAYQIVSMLEGVVKRGTAVRASRLNRTLGGKTGTTNNSYDAWFIGFSSDLVVGVYIGYDSPHTLGAKETGASAALPVFISFMEKALANKPDTPFRIPPGIKLVRINRHTGTLPGLDTPDSDIILEAFKTGTEPRMPVSDFEQDGSPLIDQPADDGTGGIY